MSRATAPRRPRESRRADRPDAGAGISAGGPRPIDLTSDPDARLFPGVAVVDCLERWQREPGPAARRRLASVISAVLARAGAQGALLEIDAEPFRPLVLGVGTLGRASSRRSALPAHELRAGEVIVGRLRIDAPTPVDEATARTVGRAVVAAWHAAVSAETTRQLEALEVATRAIAGVLSVDRVLQQIVDVVRDLVGARYAALGTSDQEGQIDRFITSGISRAERERIGDPPRGHGLLGLLIREGSPLRVDEIAAHPASVGFPANHPPMRSLLGVPLVAKGRIVGDLYLTEKEGGSPFTERDQAIVERFALHAAIAIENARLHEQISRLAVVEERERIGKDLHDGIIQAIYAVGLSLEDVPELMGPDPEEATVRVDRAIEHLNLVIRDIRNFIFGLRPELLERAGLHAGLSALADEFRVNTMIDVELEFDGREEIHLDDDEVLQLLHIAREALSNVARHSKATQARIALTTPDGGVRVEIADNGGGFATDASRGPGHQGLANMRGRAVGLGGRFDVESAPGDGTRIIVTVPGPGDAAWPDRAHDTWPPVGGVGPQTEREVDRR